MPGPRARRERGSTPAPGPRVRAPGFRVIRARPEGSRMAVPKRLRTPPHGGVLPEASDPTPQGTVLARHRSAPKVGTVPLSSRTGRWLGFGVGSSGFSPFWAPSPTTLRQPSRAAWRHPIRPRGSSRWSTAVTWPGESKRAMSSRRAAPRHAITRAWSQASGPAPSGTPPMAAKAHGPNAPRPASRAWLRGGRGRRRPRRSVIQGERSPGILDNSRAYP
jgi:hypothetical protein